MPEWMHSKLHNLAMQSNLGGVSVAVINAILFDLHN